MRVALRAENFIVMRTGYFFQADPDAIERYSEWERIQANPPQPNGDEPDELASEKKK